ncbi:MAG: S1C family serine protease, partial [Phycisphaerae bacterium]
VPLQAGHSGGPLLDVTGNVVGINTAAVTHRLTGRRTGYAVPMTAGIRNLVQRMLTGQPVAHGYLGVTVCTCPIHRGSVTIDDILPNSPAHHAGLRSGDAIVRWNDTPVHSAAHLAKLVHAQQPGQTASLLTQRTGRISVTLDRRP